MKNWVRFAIREISPVATLGHTHFLLVFQHWHELASAFLAYKERKKTKERTLFLVAFILFLGMAMVPAVPEHASEQFVVEDAASQADMPTTRTMKIPVTHDVSVVNGSYANSNMDGYPDLFVGVGVDGEWLIGRSWLKFDLTHLSKEMTVQAATLNAYLTEEWEPADEPVGVYHCTNDSWDFTTITWNNQPDISVTYSDVIDAPASPDTFVAYNWYSWEVTDDVRATLAGDKVLTEVLRQTVEVGITQAFLYFERITAERFNGAYLEINYTTPTTTELTVEGIESGPLLD
ncbi:DNRLRE domain-containing protein, partial [Candidatus Thorarchaeota archaeon]